MLSCIALVEGIGALVGQLVLTEVYSVTLLVYSGIFLFVCAGLILVTMLGTLYVHILTLVQNIKLLL